ncbi:MAG: hypothetical protein H6R32_319, partial [Candidatus Aminicenantes bacterium]|nr:hypothetical protein [Candidatus Aminicenantes bacterium]
VVMEVDRDSRAYATGLRGLTRDAFGRLLIRDVITAIDAMKIKSWDDLFTALDGYKIKPSNATAFSGSSSARLCRTAPTAARWRATRPPRGAPFSS